MSTSKENTVIIHTAKELALQAIDVKLQSNAVLGSIYWEMITTADTPEQALQQIEVNQELFDNKSGMKQKRADLSFILMINSYINGIEGFENLTSRKGFKAKVSKGNLFGVRQYIMVIGAHREFCQDIIDSGLFGTYGSALHKGLKGNQKFADVYPMAAWDLYGFELTQKGIKKLNDDERSFFENIGQLEKPVVEEVTEEPTEEVTEEVTEEPTEEVSDNIEDDSDNIEDDSDKPKAKGKDNTPKGPSEAEKYLINLQSRAIGTHQALKEFLETNREELPEDLYAELATIKGNLLEGIEEADKFNK